MMKLATLAVLGAFLLLPLHSQASVAGDIAAGVPADQVIANALADGLNINQIADQIAQEVGSSNIGLFTGPLLRTLATATDSSPGDETLTMAVNAAVGAANANNYPGRQVGQAYVQNPANFNPVAVATIRGTTGVMALSNVAQFVVSGVLAGGPPGVGRPGVGGGGGGGRGLSDAICESVGSQPGCLD